MNQKEKKQMEFLEQAVDLLQGGGGRKGCLDQ